MFLADQVKDFFPGLCSQLKNWLAQCHFSEWMGYYVYLRQQIETWIRSGPVTEELKTIVVHRSNLIINDIKPVYSLNLKK